MTGAAWPFSCRMPSPDPAYLAYLHAETSEDDFNACQSDEDGDEYQALCSAYIDSERTLAATPASSLVGILGKIRRLAADRDWHPENPVLESRLGLSVMADLERMVTAIPSRARHSLTAKSDS